MKINLLLFLSLRPKNFIENSQYPTCKDCIYFKESPDPFDKYHLSNCVLFGEKDNISGKIEYKYTKTCRNNNHLCGKNGKYYKENILI